jgi:hypothetical protein
MLKRPVDFDHRQFTLPNWQLQMAIAKFPSQLNFFFNLPKFSFKLPNFFNIIVWSMLKV